MPDESSARAERGRELARAGAVSDVAVGPGSISARVAGSSGGSYAVSLEAAPIPAGSGRRRSGRPAGGPSWSRASRGPRSPSISPTCSRRSSESRSCRRRGASARAARAPTASDRACASTSPRVAFAVADAIDRDPALLLRWRGCAARRAARVAQRGSLARGPLPAPRSLRALPPGIVVKRLGRSGIRVGGRDLADALEPAYRAFAATARRGSEPRPVIIETWSSDSAS